MSTNSTPMRRREPVCFSARRSLSKTPAVAVTSSPPWDRPWSPTMSTDRQTVSSPARTNSSARFSVRSMPLVWNPMEASVRMRLRAREIISASRGVSRGSPMPLRSSPSRWGKAGARASNTAKSMSCSGMFAPSACLTHMAQRRLQRVVVST